MPEHICKGQFEDGSGVCDVCGSTLHGWIITTPEPVGPKGERHDLYCGYGAGYPCTCQIPALKAERDRYRGALEKIKELFNKGQYQLLVEELDKALAAFPQEGE